MDVKQIGERVSRESESLARVRTEMGRVIVGQEALIDRLLLALLCNNHVLIEGVPGGQDLDRDDPRRNARQPLFTASNHARLASG